MTITLGARLVHRATLHVPWIGRWVLRVWFDGAPPSGRVTVTWGKTSLVGSVLPEKSGVVVGEGVATIIGGPGWHETPPSTWLVDAMASPSRVAQQLAQAVGETLLIGSGALRAGRVAFARAEQPASQTLISLHADGALWWAGFDGVTQAALDRPVVAVSPDLVLEYQAEGRTARLNVEEPGQAPLGGQIPDAGERFAGPQRIRSLDMMADEEGVEAWVSFELPAGPVPRLASLVEAAARPSAASPHATWRAATVQSQDAQRRASLRHEERDKELDDALPVPSWCGVPGVSAEVFSGTRTLVAFDRADPTNPIAALWSPFGHTGHTPKKVYHEAHEELRFVGASAGVGRFGLETLPVAKALHTVNYLTALETWALSVDLAIAPMVALLTPPQQAAYTAAVSARTAAAANIAQIPATKLEAQ
jgi:hypothetical protein